MKKSARVIAGLLAVLMIGMALVQLISTPVWAADVIGEDCDLDKVTTTSNSEVTFLNKGTKYNITFYADVPATAVSGSGWTNTVKNASGATSNVQVNPSNTWRYTTDAEVTASYVKPYNSTTCQIKVTLSNVTYQPSTTGNRSITVSVKGLFGSDDGYFSFSLPESYVKQSTGSTDPDTNPYTSQIVIENVLVRDANDQTLTKVDKDTPPFTIDIVYAEYGLREADDDTIDSAELVVYLTESGGFTPHGGARGTLRSILRDSNDVPRFRATFTNVTYDGMGSSISFHAQYLVDGWPVSGDSNARVYAAATDDEDDDDETAPPTPYIIISRYGYGAEAIEAGSSFTLDMAFANTSSSIDLENIVMTVTPTATSATEGDVPLSIASASNTYYYNSLPAGGGISEAVDLNVKPDSKVGSAGVRIAFTYEYVVDKKRESNETSVEIAIPITQIDRFSVDPITDFSTWMTVGEEGWVTVSFVNRGKSPTYNISGYILNPDGTPGQTEHHGNLQAGENGSLDFSLVVHEAGEYFGTVVIQYEDENSEQKELTETFSTTVEEPWYGGWEVPEDPGMWEEEAPPSTPTWKIVLLLVGGIAIAAPVALYVTKRVHAKGSEDFDEDF